MLGLRVGGVEQLRTEGSFVMRGVTFCFCFGGGLSFTQSVYLIWCVLGGGRGVL